MRAPQTNYDSNYSVAAFQQKINFIIFKFGMDNFKDVELVSKRRVVHINMFFF